MTYKERTQNVQPLTRKEQGEGRKRKEMAGEIPSPQTYLIEPDNIRVLKKLHDLYFSGHFLPVLLIQPSLVNDLDGNLHTNPQ